MSGTERREGGVADGDLEEFDLEEVGGAVGSVGPVAAEVYAELVEVVGGDDDMVETPRGLHEKSMMPDGYSWESSKKPGPEQTTRL
ncbi:hypothetical protein HOG17_02275 [Candidatus Peregrinibacteria bacterium]|jgi:hypothetical protein|nr:hypothetical protein [Candidatus Peregrinibacteria bacterium]MBT4147741.1 hypothetical protein [Candidatus Peregrinibacteria bacterium]MBT4365948.1 hypothetical protein [Candidatus Peregrinibacteria bacterium]MBT4456573.1 hypothetical protein [Candidatus Peregrinibacteria bacterium]